MHELGITRSIIEIAEQNARREGAQKIVSITVTIGDLSGVVPDAVEFAFEVCSRGTLLDDAELIIERIPGRGRCSECGGETTVDRYSFACPVCNTLGLELLQGEELQIKEMEID